MDFLFMGNYWWRLHITWQIMGVWVYLHYFSTVYICAHNKRHDNKIKTVTAITEVPFLCKQVYIKSLLHCKGSSLVPATKHSLPFSMSPSNCIYRSSTLKRKDLGSFPRNYTSNSISSSSNPYIYVKRPSPS